MGFDAWITLGVLAAIFYLLAFTRYGADTILFGALSLLLVFNVVTPAQAFSGFTNEGIITVGVLFVVATGLRETGAVWVLIQRLLGRCQSIVVAQARIMFPVAFLSAFWNNTPLVAVLLPAIQDWGRKYQLPVSKLLIPLSYAAILGGMCTIMGTSTNLVVNGLLTETPMPVAGAELSMGGMDTMGEVVVRAETIVRNYPGLGFFEIAWVGLPCALVGISFVLLFGRKLLPDRRPDFATPEDLAREYVVEMTIESVGPLVGKTLDESTLLELHGIYLMEIERDGRVNDDPQTDDRLAPGDHLTFVGLIDAAVELQKTPGLLPSSQDRAKLDTLPQHRCLVEAVVSSNSPMLGRTISEGRFHTHYNAVVIGAQRDGQRVEKRLGDIVPRPGDTLLLETHPLFVDQYRNSRDFYLVSRIEGYTPPRHDRAWVALAVLAAMILAVSFGWLTLLKASLLAAGLMLLTNCCLPEVARRGVDWRLLITIASAFGVGKAMYYSGAAGTIASGLISLAEASPWIWLTPWFALALIHLTTMIFTELISNNAAAVLVFPIAVTTSSALGVDLMPFVICVMVAGSASFATPIGYQTNLMVYGPGGYRFSDFLKIGVPLNLLIAAVAILLTPWIWPF